MVKRVEIETRSPVTPATLDATPEMKRFQRIQAFRVSFADACRQLMLPSVLVYIGI